MRAMSWSRYRCLSLSFVRIRTRLHRRKLGPHKRSKILRYGLFVLGFSKYPSSR